jgi:hypothetical protein
MTDHNPKKKDHYSYATGLTQVDTLGLPTTALYEVYLLSDYTRSVHTWYDADVVKVRKMTITLDAMYRLQQGESPLNLRYGEDIKGEIKNCWE